MAFARGGTSVQLMGSAGEGQATCVRAVQLQLSTYIQFIESWPGSARTCMHEGPGLSLS